MILGKSTLKPKGRNTTNLVSEALTKKEFGC